jgi:hypothetical protein
MSLCHLCQYHITHSQPIHLPKHQLVSSILDKGTHTIASRHNCGLMPLLYQLHHLGKEYAIIDSQPLHEIKL